MLTFYDDSNHILKYFEISMIIFYWNILTNVESVTKHANVASLFNYPHDADLIKAKEKLRIDNQKLNQFQTEEQKNFQTYENR